METSKTGVKQKLKAVALAKLQSQLFELMRIWYDIAQLKDQKKAQIYDIELLNDSKSSVLFS